MEIFPGDFDRAMLRREPEAGMKAYPLRTEYGDVSRPPIRHPVMRLLLLEDDRILGDGISAYLRGEGCGVDWCQRLQQVRADALSGYDALLVDWQLPDGSGLEWVRSLRQRRIGTPILVLTARDRLADRIHGLDSGADDYLVKPFAVEELSARIRAATRRAAGLSPPRLQFGEVEVDLTARAAYRAAQRVELTAREWGLLEALARRAGRIVSRDELETLVHGADGGPASNALEVHLSSLRRKLGRDLVSTVRGLGYRIDR
jgi:two-component system OmpR family response regulator